MSIMIFSSKNSVLFLITGKLQGPALLTMKTNCLSGCLSIGMNLVGGGYAEGLFWLVNPQEYEGLLEHWLASTEFYLRDNYYVIARSAFGKLYVWGEKSGWCLSISPHAARYSGRVSKFTGDRLSFGVSVFFAFVRPEHNDLNGLFKPALEKLGQLSSDEMYGFVPALALGGAMELRNLQKVKTIEHLEFLSQLSPLQDWGFPEF
ncbi:GAD-like domain protein [compost metagenome]